MTNRDDPSFVELFEDIELPLPKDEFAFAAFVFDWIVEKIYTVHDFLCRSRED
jgi:hypothetical protein